MKILKTLEAKLRTTLLDRYPVFVGCDQCPHHIPPIDERTHCMPMPAFPVDVVYTWVDGKDIRHNIDRICFARKMSNFKLNSPEFNLARFRDNNELLYSLRSLECYLPWVNRIFIVTDSQIPKWLNTAHKKIKIIDHKQIIDEQYLPTFNSHVIEANLHKIPELSEYFLYLNDDIFFCRNCTKADFFTANGIPFIFTDWRDSRLAGFAKYHTKAHAASFFNVLEYLINAGFDPARTLVTAHGPFPQCRIDAMEAYNFFEPIILSFSANRFRTSEEIAFYAHALPIWSYLHRRAIPCDINHYFISVERTDQPAYYNYLLSSTTGRHMPLFICINEGTTTKFATREMNNFLSKFYPKSSQFEV